jgi:hypothetical protein
VVTQNNLTTSIDNLLEKMVAIVGAKTVATHTIGSTESAITVQSKNDDGNYLPGME